MSKPLLFPITVGEEEIEAKVFHRRNEEEYFLRIVTKGVYFMDLNLFDLLKFLRIHEVIEDENDWEQDGPLRKFEARTKTSSFIFKKTS